MINDAHAHIFPAVTGLGRDDHHNAHTAAMLIAAMDDVGVERTMLLQGPYWGECNDFAAEAVRAYPGRLAAQAYLDPWLNNWPARLDEVLATPQFRGIKIEFSEATGLAGVHPGARLDEPSLNALWRQLQSAHRILTLDLGAVGATSYQTAAVDRIAREHPELTIVICHLAQPDPQFVAAWQEQIDLGLLPNVYFDTSSVPQYFHDEVWPRPSCGRFIRGAINTVGPEKILWGSDIPGTLSHHTYAQLLELGRLHTNFLPPVQQRLILADNARRIYFDS